MLLGITALLMANSCSTWPPGTANSPILLDWYSVNQIALSGPATSPRGANPVSEGSIMLVNVRCGSCTGGVAVCVAVAVPVGVAVTVAAGCAHDQNGLLGSPGTWVRTPRPNTTSSTAEIAATHPT